MDPYLFYILSIIFIIFGSIVSIRYFFDSIRRKAYRNPEYGHKYQKYIGFRNFLYNVFFPIFCFLFTFAFFFFPINLSSAIPQAERDRDRTMKVNKINSTPQNCYVEDSVKFLCKKSLNCNFFLLDVNVNNRTVFMEKTCTSQICTAKYENITGKNITCYSVDENQAYFKPRTFTTFDVNKLKKLNLGFGILLVTVFLLALLGFIGCCRTDKNLYVSGIHQTADGIKIFLSESIVIDNYEE